VFQLCEIFGFETGKRLLNGGGPCRSFGCVSLLSDAAVGGFMITRGVEIAHGVGFPCCAVLVSAVHVPTAGGIDEWGTARFVAGGVSSRP